MGWIPSASRWAAAALAVLAVVLVAGGRGDAATPYDAEELRFLRLINDYRESNGAGPLILSDTLAVPAERHSKDMGEYGFFGHDTEKSSYYPAGSDPFDRMEAEGYDYNTFKGENLAAGCETAEQCFDLWKDSPSHNTAMLDDNYRVMGVARVNVPGSAKGWYWATEFGGFEDPSSRGSGGREPGEPGPAREKAPEGEPSGEERREARRGSEKDAGGLENGAMEKRTVWEQEAADGADLFLDGRARLGGYDDGEDDLRQKVRVGPDTRLAYGVRVRTTERGGVGGAPDAMTVRLVGADGGEATVLRRHTQDDAGGWRRVGVDLPSRLAGKTVFLTFHAETDRELPTTFYVDNVVASERPASSPSGR